MSLHLDARQRAMLQEMGVTVWSPAEDTPAPMPMAQPAEAPATQTPPAAPPPKATPAQPPERRAPAAAAPLSTPADAAPPAAPHGLVLREPQALYPTADPAHTPAELGAGWLIVMEHSQPGEPLAGDAGRLLDNMLRAMRLHRHPRVFLAALERPLAGAAPAAETSAGPDVQAALAHAVTTLQPAMVLVLGLVAARVALGRTEPLGRLRAEVHQLSGHPAIVSYEPAHLLRSASTKPAAWADLCRALAIVRNSVRNSVQASPQTTARAAGAD